MFVDASAMVAVITREPEAAEFVLRIREAAVRYISPIAAYEAVLAVSRIRRAPVTQAQGVLGRFTARASIQVIPITAEIGRLAIDAFARYGRGNHPARLNMGDCFAYACARSLGVPLLCKGGDFAQTDIALA
jgi:ribonuclease VapC